MIPFLLTILVIFAPSAFAKINNVQPFVAMSNKDIQFNESDPEVVSQVDLNKYAGRWYEIAHDPNFFQKKCIRSKTEYKVISTDSLSVVNSCITNDNETREIKGTAKVVNPQQPAKLKVKFGFMRRGDYWIVDLDPNYQWAVVSGPRKSSLFILSRVAPMNEQLKAEIIQKLTLRGFKTDDLIYDQY